MATHPGVNFRPQPGRWHEADVPTDGELLTRFLAHREEVAFEALVHRHGPMVLGVCRRVLRNGADAEDAFQATFLLLVQKAASLRQRDLLGNWLYGVAYRTALAARAAAYRRRFREKQVSTLPEAEAAEEPILWRDLHPILDQEVNRLPEKYRKALILCDLEGGTRRAVARSLGIPLGTLSGRLTTARRRLARRLARRGFVFSGDTLCLAVDQDATQTCVPTLLLGTTVTAATNVLAGKPGHSAEVAAMVEHGVQGLTRRKVVGLLLASGFLLGAGVGAALMASRDTPATKIFTLDARGRRVAWSPDGKTLAVVTKVEKSFLGFQYDRSGSALQLWDVVRGQPEQTLAQDPEKGLAFAQVLFSPDGSTIAAPVTEVVCQPNLLTVQSVIKLWDVKTRKLRQTLPGGGQLVDLALSPDGRLLAAPDPSQKCIKLWNTQTGRLERSLPTGAARPWSLAFSPDSKFLLVGAQKSDGSGEVGLWSVAGRLQYTVSHARFVTAVAYAPDGKKFASSDGSDAVQIREVGEGKLLHTLPGNPRGPRTIAFSPDGKSLAVGARDGTVRLWDVVEGKLARTLHGHEAEVYSVAFSPNGETLASVSQDQTLRLWPVAEVP